MVRFIFGIILLIATFILLKFAKEVSKAEETAAKTVAKGMKTVSVITTILAVTLLVTSCIRTVPTGHTGIVTTFGKVENYNFDSGVHFTAPWKTVINMDNRTQKQTLQMNAFSSDIQEVSVTYTLNYQIDKANAQNIYKNIGADYYNVVVLPRTLESVKAVIAKYDAENLVASRGKLSKEIEEILVTALAKDNITITTTSLEDLDFTDTFTDAVEAKVKAEQDKLTAEATAKKEIVEANAEAEKKRIAAQAEADALLIAAQNDVEVQKLAADASEYAGQKQASINERIAQSLTPELNQYYAIEAWKAGGSQMPSTMLGDEGISGFINIK